MAASIECETMKQNRGALCFHWCCRIFSVACLFCSSLSVLAHTPHDAIDRLLISPDYENDTTLFIIAQNRLLRSTNRAETWKPLVRGLDSPHLFSDIAISSGFAQDNTLFVSTDGGGIYESTNRGLTWNRFNDGLRQKNIGKLLVVTGSDDIVVLAAGSSRGLFVRSAQDSQWRRAMSDDVQITSLALFSNKSSTYAFAGDSSGGIWKSNTDFQEWRRVARLDDAGAITSLAALRSGISADTLLAGTERAGLFRVSDKKARFENLSQEWPDRLEDCNGKKLAKPVPDLHIRDIETSATADGGQRISITTWNNAVYVSIDSGNTWEIKNRGLSCENQADSGAFKVPHFRDLETGGTAGSDWFLAGFDGLFRSADDGDSWIQVETFPVSLIRGFAVSPANGDQHALAATTYGGGAYVSPDRGQSWMIVNNGLVTTRLADFEFSPNYPTDGQVFTVAKERLLSSNEIDHGWTGHSLVYRGWRRRVGSGLERHLNFSEKYGSQLFLSDAERRNLWPMQIDLSPEFANDQTIFLGFRRHGVWKSNNAGVDWDRSWDGPISYVTDLQVSPGYSNDGTVFAGIRGAGIYVTRDGADSWNASNAGLQFFAELRATESPNYVMDPPLFHAIRDIRLVVSPAYTEDRTVFASTSAGLFKSTNGGQSWLKLFVAMSLTDVPVSALGVSPAFDVDRTILAAFKGRGLYRSTDSGETFSATGPNLLTDNFDLQYIQFSPTYQKDGRIYGATNFSLLVSSDRGATWSVISRPVRYEDSRGGGVGPVLFSAEWSQETGPQFSASMQTVSDREGAQASLVFSGRNISWRGERGPDGGQARVTIDGGNVFDVDLFSKNKFHDAIVFKSPELEDGPHSILIEIIKGKNANSTGHRVTVDAFDVAYQ